MLNVGALLREAPERHKNKSEKALLSSYTKSGEGLNTTALSPSSVILYWGMKPGKLDGNMPALFKSRL